ncbi:unnamed protein product [Meganyctiphanes norvegica]|uniref:Hemolymph juvenile hormone binding protein n=1 Tax=Meganyctiphanes norvegica TaxID=48144 RepID=A0AAV2RFI5_MEGNR
MKVFITFLVLGVLAAVANAAEFASSLRQCRVNNNNELNSCLIQTMEALRPHLHTGVPELSLPILEPMFIPNLNFRQGNGAVNINAVFRNLEIRGLSSFNTTYIEADPLSQTLNVGLYIPELRVTGSYDLDGLLLVLPIKGQGPFWTTFNGIHANGVGSINIAGQAPSERLQVSNVFVDFDIDRMRVNLDNLFGGDPILGEAVHLFLNDNGKEVLGEIKPEIQRRLNDLVQKVMNDAFSQLPVDAFLLRN